MRNIWIVGPPGSGKTYLSKRIASACSIAHIELDNLYWKENWGRSDDAEFVKSIKKCMDMNKEYIIDGYYASAQSILESKASIIIKLDVSIYKLYIRVIFRSLFRIITKRKVCGNNKESLRNFFSRDGLFKYIFSQYKIFKKEFSVNEQCKLICVNNNRISQKKFLKLLKKIDNT